MELTETSTALSTIIELVDFEAISKVFKGIVDITKPIAATGLEWAGIKEVPNLFK